MLYSEVPKMVSSYFQIRDKKYWFRLLRTIYIYWNNYMNKRLASDNVTHNALHFFGGKKLKCAVNHKMALPAILWLKSVKCHFMVKIQSQIGIYLNERITVTRLKPKFTQLCLYFWFCFNLEIVLNRKYSEETVRLLKTSGFNRACTFVIHNNDAIWGDLGFGHLECRRDGAIGKQPFSTAQRYRKYL